MEIWKLFKSQNNSRGQVSFEFIIVLALVGILSSTILADFYYESNDTFILSAIKATTLNEINKINSQLNTDCYLKSMTLIGESGVQLDIEGEVVKCLIVPSTIADSVEKDYCEIIPNADAIVDCAEGYSLTVV